ncbi:MAG: hypothetical protein KDM63_10205 [Verrucomicrobiae bacterium]|nr:hypothetical protein [Verrucomicrobiae bacterium]
MPAPTEDQLEELRRLASALENRLNVIADTARRDRDPADHLEALKSASEAIQDSHLRLKGQIHPRLEHFLANCSYQKALAMIENELIS